MSETAMFFLVGTAGTTKFIFSIHVVPESIYRAALAVQGIVPGPARASFYILYAALHPISASCQLPEAACRSWTYCMRKF